MAKKFFRWNTENDPALLAARGAMERSRRDMEAATAAMTAARVTAGERALAAGRVPEAGRGDDQPVRHEEGRGRK